MQGYLALKRVRLTSIMHTQAVHKAEVGAGGHGITMAFFQPVDDCGSDTSKSDPLQKQWVRTRSVRVFQASWPLTLLFLPDLDTQLHSLPVFKPLPPCLPSEMIFFLPFQSCSFSYTNRRLSFRFHNNREQPGPGWALLYFSLKIQPHVKIFVSHCLSEILFPLALIGERITLHCVWPLSSLTSS